MIKAVEIRTLYKALADRLNKLDEAETMPDPGPNFPSQRNSQLYLLAYRRGAVRSIADLIVQAESPSPGRLSKLSANQKVLRERVIAKARKKMKAKAKI